MVAEEVTTTVAPTIDTAIFHMISVMAMYTLVATRVAMELITPPDTIEVH